MYSATKHIDGQGRVLGGAILGKKSFVKKSLSLSSEIQGLQLAHLMLGCSQKV